MMNNWYASGDGRGSTLWQMVVAVTLLLALVGPAAHAQTPLVIHPGESVDGQVRSRLGQAWQFQGCEGDVVTLTAEADDFVPFLALFDTTSADALIEADGDEDELRAEIVDFELPATDNYSVLVAGSTVRDRGPYALTLEIGNESGAGRALDDPDTLQVAPGQVVSGAVTSRFGEEILFHGCVDQLVSFTLESRDFVPVLELFGPSGRAPLVVGEGSGAVVQIVNFTLPETGAYTLVAAGRSVLARGAFTLAMLDANRQLSPPTPTATSTNAPTPTATAIATATPIPTATATPAPAPTATPLSAALLPQGIPIQVNGGDGDLLGEIFMNPSYMVSAFEEDDTLVVGQNFYLELFVFDIRVGLFNGAGIDRVEFVFDCPNGEQYIRVERSPRYCSFSDDGGSCFSLRLRAGENFPGSSCEIVNDFYYVNVNAYPVNRNLRPGNWNFYLRPEIP